MILIETSALYKLFTYLLTYLHMLPDTSCSFRIHVECSLATYLLFINITVNLYPFVSSNRRATNWQQFCCRYKKHVDGNKWIKVDTTCIRQHVSWCKRGFRQERLLLLATLFCCKICKCVNNSWSLLIRRLSPSHSLSIFCRFQTWA